MYLSDLTFIDETSNKLEEGLINFTKRRRVAAVLRDIMQYQQTPYCYREVPFIREFIKKGTCKYPSKTPPPKYPIPNREIDKKLKVLMKKNYITYQFILNQKRELYRSTGQPASPSILFPGPSRLMPRTCSIPSAANAKILGPRYRPVPVGYRPPPRMRALRTRRLATHRNVN